MFSSDVYSYALTQTTLFPTVLTLFILTSSPKAYSELRLLSSAFLIVRSKFWLLRPEARPILEEPYLRLTGAWKARRFWLIVRRIENHRKEQKWPMPNLYIKN